MFKDKLKAIFAKSEIEGNNKKKIENLVFFVIVLIITIVIINYIWNGNRTSNKTITNTAGKQLASTQNANKENSTVYSSNSLEEKLQDILSNINGVGDVKVFINYSESNCCNV